MNSAPLLTRKEVTEALATLAARGKKDSRRLLWRNNLVIFALVTCAGLSATEISSLDVGDFHAHRPVIKGSSQPAANCLRLGRRLIPLHWHQAANAALLEHYDFRLSQSALTSDPLVVSLKAGTGHRLSPGHVLNTYKAACKYAGIASERRLPSLGIASLMANALEAGIDAEQIRQAQGLLLEGENIKCSPLSGVWNGLLGL